MADATGLADLGDDLRGSLTRGTLVGGAHGVSGAVGGVLLEVLQADITGATGRNLLVEEGLDRVRIERGALVEGRIGNDVTRAKPGSVCHCAGALYRCEQRAQQDEHERKPYAEEPPTLDNVRHDASAFRALPSANETSPKRGPRSINRRGPLATRGSRSPHISSVPRAQPLLPAHRCYVPLRDFLHDTSNSP